MNSSERLVIASVHGAKELWSRLNLGIVLHENEVATPDLSNIVLYVDVGNTDGFLSQLSLDAILRQEQVIIVGTEVLQVDEVFIITKLMESLNYDVPFLSIEDSKIPSGNVRYLRGQRRQFLKPNQFYRKFYRKSGLVAKNRSLRRNGRRGN
jgi:hypothetical protein